MSASEIVNAASTAWGIIKDGKPSAQIANTTANAVPKVDDWTSLQGAREKSTWVRRWNSVGWPFDDYVNVDFKIDLKWDFGATYRGGGLFIPNIYIEVPVCFVGWTYTVDIDIQVRNPTNDGTESAPVARVPISISGTMGNYTWSDRVGWSFTIWGSGDWQRS